MKITILCSDSSHPVYKYLHHWQKVNESKHDIKILNSVNSIREGGDILFLISCSEIVRQDIRDKFNFTLVLHASDLPQGRGWSPHIWDVLNGSQELTLSLLNAEDSVDTGDIWQKLKIPLDGLELYDEVNSKLFEAELQLMDWACENIYTSQPESQPISESHYYRKRAPEDSQVDINESIVSQFNLLRISDPDRYPAYIVVQGQKYKIRLEKVDD
ncbi:UDP-glucuronic acid dehydrogenase [Vibrio fortis]|uniref:UDP-glucuronic acid dehydrogenase n=1 Tax=Vibrio fortis TaxID=212667 RepID=A0A5N3R0A2_9VIBR|nr:formyltransferase family protein [Vibrio fortis]KAB0287452.1 UDP-glucuronic acid dehydrogenase [Vibrio fortis]